MRIFWLAVGAVALLGCESLEAPTPLPQRERGPGLSPPLPKPDGAAGAASKQGEELQQAAASPSSEPDALTLAAECLERGDCANAAVHLETYVCRHPDQIMFRAQLAELLIRAGRDAAAKVHYERFVAEAQAATGAPRNHLVTAHTRLMEIAQRAEDRPAELFHRGAGLLLLAKAHQKLPDADPEFGEELLCKAMKALAEAKHLNPSDARTRVYLAEVYERCGNRRAAEAERAAARHALVPGELTAQERRECLVLDTIAR